VETYNLAMKYSFKKDQANRGNHPQSSQ